MQCYYFIIRMMYCILIVIVMDNCSWRSILDLFQFKAEKSKVNKHLDYFSKYSIN